MLPLIDMESNAKSISHRQATPFCIFVIESASEQWRIMLKKAFCCRRVVVEVLAKRILP